MIATQNTTTTRTIKLATGQTFQCRPMCYDQNGRPINPLPGTPSYASDTPSVATVDAASGKVTAVAPGAAVITVTAGSITGHLTISVYAPNPTTVVI